MNVYSLISGSMHACMLSHFSCVQLCATLCTIARQAPLSMGFPRQEYWSGLPCPPPGDLTDPGIKPTSLMSPALAGRLFTASTTWEGPFWFYKCPVNLSGWSFFSIFSIFLHYFGLLDMPVIERNMLNSHTRIMNLFIFLDWLIWSVNHILRLCYFTKFRN